MSDLDKAREWSDRIRNTSVNGYPTNADCYSAAEVIQSLPDQWVDVEKVREVLFHMREASLFDENLQPHVDALERLLAPKLPTLADMTQEEREACQWMQCKIDGQLAGILARVDAQRGHIWVDSGYSLGWKLENITPLPDLPKLKWPGDGVVDCEIVDEPEPVDAPPAEKVTLGGMWVDDGSSPVDAIKFLADKYEEHDQQLNSSEFPKSSIKPEDVPANEPWLIEVGGRKAIGTRCEDDEVVPWVVASIDGSFVVEYHDSVVTLIHKLVPEPPALPEGMRLADHEEYGRVVVSPYPDAGNDYRVFYSRDRIETETGASWGYANKNELTFLDGEK